MATITLSDGTELYYEISGWENSGAPIVFLNGMSQSTLHWRSHVRHFETTSRVITYNARGQGGYPVGPSELTLRQHCEDLIELFGALSVDTVKLVGFSHGARVALGFASYFPSLVERLILVSATARMTVRARLIVQSWLEVLDAGGLEAMVWSSLPTILGNAYLEKHERMIPGIIKASLQRNSLDGMKKLLAAMQNFPVLEDLVHSVTAPSLVISGTEDPLVTTDGAATLASSLNGRHIVFEDVGHTVPIEVPKEFQKIVGDFLNE